MANESREDLQKAFNAISAKGAEPAGLIFLSDADHKVISRYGILNPQSKGLPHPATYVIDKNGIVRWKFVEVDYRIRPTNEQILDALGNLR